ncbi:uncharacterized protein K02A2.6-like [Armigeres subalbatus]|uniref:uncharacterized protein K02A2.6-like n=1 Tax=Armigeres subalbatus TaxID=124917 RepID=UPI002ED1D269
MKEEQFKCLVFVCGLKSDKDTEVRLRLLSKIEERNDVTLEQLSEECQRLLNLRHDTAMIEEHSAAVNALRNKQQRYKRGSPLKFHQAGEEKSSFGSSSSKTSPETACWLCGGMHYARECTYKSNKCNDCGKVGHKTGYCRSAMKVKFRRRRPNVASTKVVTVNSCSVQQRRKFVPVGINGSPVRLQIDTGSDITIISSESWRKIGSPSTTVSTIVAKSASGKALQIEGEFACDLSIDGRVLRGIVRVAKEQLHLLGSDMIDAFGLWSVPFDSICNGIRSTPASIFGVGKDSLIAELRQETQGGFNKLSPAILSPAPVWFQYNNRPTLKRTRERDEAILPASDRPQKIFRGTNQTTSDIAVSTERPENKFWIYLMKISSEAAEDDIVDPAKSCLQAEDCPGKQKMTDTAIVFKNEKPGKVEHINALDIDLNY